MPKRKSSHHLKRNTKLSVDLKFLQLIIVAVLFAFAFTILSFVTQIMAPDQNKTVLELPEIVLTQANLLVNTAQWKTYSANGIKFKYPKNWTLVENVTKFGIIAGTHTFFSSNPGGTQGLALFISPKTLPGEWINTVYAPGFLKQAENISIVKIDGQTATKVIGLPQLWKNEIVFITRNNTTYILYFRGGNEEVRVFENLLRTLKFI